MDKQYGYTLPGSNYPAYFNAKAVDGQVMLTVRSPAGADGSCGSTSAMSLPPSEAIQIAIGIRDIAAETLPKFDHADEWGGPALLAEARALMWKIEQLPASEKASQLAGRMGEVSHGVQELQRTGDHFWPVHLVNDDLTKATEAISKVLSDYGVGFASRNGGTLSHFSIDLLARAALGLPLN